MKIGILSDTHDNLPKVEAAVDFFNSSRVDFVLHAGDFIAPFAAAKLNNLKSDFCGVFGNNDGEREGLIKISEGRIQPGPLRINLGGRAISLVHDISSIDVSEEKSEIIIFGHTHKPQVLQQGLKLLINPGECAGWLSGCCSVVIADLAALSAQIHYL